MKVKANYVRSILVGLLATIMLLVGFSILPFSKTKKVSAFGHTLVPSINGTVLTVSTTSSYLPKDWSVNLFEGVIFDPMNPEVIKITDFNYHADSHTGTYDLQQLINNKSIKYNVTYTINCKIDSISETEFKSLVFNFTYPYTVPLFSVDNLGAFQDYGIMGVVTLGDASSDILSVDKFQKGYTVTGFSGFTKQAETLDKFSFICPKEYLGSVDVDKTKFVTCILSAPPIELPEPPVKEGYTFVGWYLDVALTIPYTNQPITSDMQFYPKFALNILNISFNSNGGTAVANTTVNYNAVLTLPTPPTRIGYVFLGWWNGDAKYTNQPITANTELVAHWELQKFTVTFYFEGKVYKTLLVDYGSVFKTVLAANSVESSNVVSVSSGNNSSIVLDDTLTVSEDMSVSIVMPTKIDKGVNYFLAHWKDILVIGGVSILAFGCLIFCVTGFSKKRGR